MSGQLPPGAVSSRAESQVSDLLSACRIFSAVDRTMLEELVRVSHVRHLVRDNRIEYQRPRRRLSSPFSSGTHGSSATTATGGLELSLT